jgi:hypothetical protein
MKTFTEADIRRAFIMGIASTREGFNGECAIPEHAPDHVANRGDPWFEVDVSELSENRGVIRLADEYINGVNKDAQ